MNETLDNYKDAYNKELKFYNENIMMLSWYVQRIAKRIKNNNIKSIISLGIGHKIVSRGIISELAPYLKRCLIIEGSQKIIKEFCNEVTLPSNVFLVCSLFEKFETKERFDAIEMGFVLEHVNEPLSLIKQYVNYLKPNGSIFIAVPNARSLHRLIGQKAGILDNLYRLGEHDLKYGHQRYFDMSKLIKLVLASNLKIINVEGIFLKPFSTSQLKSLNLSSEVLNALCHIGVEYPEISNAIYLEANFDPKE